MLTKRHPKYLRSNPSWQDSHEGSIASTKPTVSPSNSQSPPNPDLLRISISGFFMKMKQSLPLYFRAPNQWPWGTPTTFREPLAERRALLFLVDTLILMFATFVAYSIAGDASLNLKFLALSLYWNTTIAILVVWWLLSALNDLYDISSTAHIRATGTRLLVIGLMGAMLYWTLWVLGFRGQPTVYFIAIFAAIGLPTIWGWRSLCTMLAHWWASEQRVLIIGLGRPGEIIHELLQKADYLKYRVVGFVAEADDVPVGSEQRSTEILGSVRDLPSLIQEHNVNEVVLATQGDLSGDVFQQLVVCQGQGVKISWMPTLYERLCYSVPIEYVDPEWALFAMQDQPIFSRLQLTVKRLVDIGIVLLCLPTFLLLIPLLALLIRLDSPGPIFYRQVRTGRGGKPFSIWKFRTMVTDAEKDGKPRWAQQNDDRITRIGRIMRKTRLDEIPQIFNILLGDMSLVGPRPERPEFIEVLQKEIPYYHTRLMVKPGLTGWAQVSYDYGNTTDDALKKLHYDFYYIRYWSLWLDFYIIFKTIEIVFKFKGM